MAEYISSMQNPVVKLLKSLHSKKGRYENGLFLVEGMRLCSEICAPWQTEFLIFSERFYEESAEREELIAGCPEAKVRILPEEVFAAVSDTQHPQGVLAAVRQRQFDLSAFIQKKDPFLVVLEDLQDPGNAGTILRTADAAGADGILCSKGTVDFYSPKTVRASMGSIFHLPVVQSQSFAEALAGLREHGVHLLAAHLQGSRPHFEADYSGGCAIMIGNEGNGLTPEAAALADERVRIPQPGRAESLNASVAAGILIYEALRQRTGGEISCI